MSISIFTIKGHNQSFYNLDNAIHAAKDIVKNKVIEQITMLKENATKWNPEEARTTFSNENLRECKLKYSVTQNAPNEIRVRAISSLCAALLCCAMVGSSLNWCGMRLLLYWH